MGTTYSLKTWKRLKYIMVFELSNKMKLSSLTFARQVPREKVCCAELMNVNSKYVSPQLSHFS